MKTNFVKIIQNLQSCTKQCLTLKWKSNIVEYECQGVNLLCVKKKWTVDRDMYEYLMILMKLLHTVILALDSPIYTSVYFELFTFNLDWNFTGVLE